MVNEDNTYQSAEARHSAFVHHYLTNGYNARQAYLSVYKETTVEAADVSAHRLLKHPKVKSLIDTKMGEMDAKLDTSLQGMLERIEGIINQEIQEIPEQKDKVNMMLRAIDMMNKMVGNYKKEDSNQAPQLNITFVGSNKALEDNQLPSLDMGFTDAEIIDSEALNEAKDDDEDDQDSGHILTVDDDE